MAFICNDYQKLKTEIGIRWRDPNVAGKLELDPIEAAKCVLEGQGMTAIADWENGVCREQETTWTFDCSDNATKATTIPDVGCDINMTATEADCDSITYAPNCYGSETGQFTDQQCNNETSRVTESARQINKIVNNLRRQLVREAVLHLSASADANQIDPNLIQGTINGNLTEYPSASLNENILAEWELTAKLNGMNSYKILSGTNFYTLKRTHEEKKACCSDQGANNIFAAFPMVWDVTMDATLGRRSTFLFNPEALGFQNFVPKELDTTPKMLHLVNGEELWGWYVNDPFVRFRRIDPVTRRESLVPVKYAIYFKRTCAGSDLLTSSMYRYNWEGRVLGGFYNAPKICTPSISTVLEFQCV